MTTLHPEMPTISESIFGSNGFYKQRINTDKSNKYLIGCALCNLVAKILSDDDKIEFANTMLCMNVWFVCSVVCMSHTAEITKFYLFIAL